MNLVVQENSSSSKESNLSMMETRFRVTVKIEPPVRSEKVAFLLEKRQSSYAEICLLSLDHILQTLQELSRYRDYLGRKMSEIDSSIHFLKVDKEEDNEEKILFLKSIKKKMEQERKDIDSVMKMYRHGEREVRTKSKYFGMEKG